MMKRLGCLFLAVCLCICSAAFAQESEAPLYASGIEQCTDTSKLYVLPDGYVYSFQADRPEIVIETTPGGYYNVNGEWRSQDGLTGQRTELIPVKEGDRFEVTSMGKSNTSVIWFGKNEKILSGGVMGKSMTEPETKIATTPARAAYVRFYSYDDQGGIYLKVKPLSGPGSWVNTGKTYAEEHPAASAQAGSSHEPLSGKKIIYDGDGIAAVSSLNGGGYAQIIADVTGGTFENHAQGGGRLTTDSLRHSVVDNLENLPLDGDLYCFEGGINDFWGNVPLGEITPGYTDELDETTLCGALETIFRYMMKNMTEKPVCFVITHKVQYTATDGNQNGDSFQDYRDAMVRVCEKYSIPYYDAFTRSGLNGWNPEQNARYLNANENGVGDGCHPNEDGYKRFYVPQLLALFREIMPVD